MLSVCVKTKNRQKHRAWSFLLALLFQAQIMYLQHPVLKTIFDLMCQFISCFSGPSRLTQAEMMNVCPVVVISHRLLDTN